MILRTLIVTLLMISPWFSVAASADLPERFNAATVVALHKGVNNISDCCREPGAACCSSYYIIVESIISPRETRYTFRRPDRSSDYAHAQNRAMYFQEDAYLVDSGRATSIAETKGTCHFSGIRTLLPPKEESEIVYAAIGKSTTPAPGSDCAAQVHFIVFRHAAPGCDADFCIVREWDSDKIYADVDDAFQDVGLALPSVDREMVPPWWIFPTLLGFFLVFFVLMAVLFGYPSMRIARRAGFNKWWGLLVIIPYGNIAALWIFAFCKWPALGDSGNSASFGAPQPPDLKEV